MRKINIDGLLALNLEEIEIVYRRLIGETIIKIASEIGISDSTISNQRMPKILRMLGVETWREAAEELEIPVRSIIPNVEALKRGWPEEFRGKIEGLRMSAEPPKETSTSAGETDPSLKPNQGTPRPPNLPPWVAIAVPLIVFLLLCAGGIVFAAPRLLNIFQQNGETVQATNTPATLINPTATIEPSPTLQPTDTQIALPTSTASSTLTAAAPSQIPTATITFTIAPTLDPTQLKPGDTFENGRVSLAMTNVKYNQSYYGKSAVWFDFEFKNNSGENFPLSYLPSDFFATDNNGREYKCWYLLAYPTIYDEFNQNIGPGQIHIFTVGCGQEVDLPRDVTQIFLRINNFARLPEMLWTVDV
jgi:hypothetical protein